VVSCPDIPELAPQVRCPELFLRGDREVEPIDPGDAFVARADGPAEFARSCPTDTKDEFALSAQRQNFDSVALPTVLVSAWKGTAQQSPDRLRHPSRS
jgi:hypothetical protein